MTATSTTDWAREHGTELRGWVALDNYEPTRNFAALTLWRYTRLDDDRGPGIIVEDRTELRDATHAVYLIDDGRTVEPYYVAGWGGLPEQTHVMLHPFPTNYGADGAPITRADNGRPVDFGTWMLGPRRAYHVKVTAV